jgi:sarcosine oxidase, subunit alpha
VSSDRHGPFRVARGGLVDRGRRVRFEFDGRKYEGLSGDCVASALLANRVRTVSRSFKFRRPRGVFSCGIEEPAALVQIGEGAQSVPSVRAPLVPLTPDLRVRSQRGWPSVSFDVGRVLDGMASLWSAGFYNKTFIWPRWHTYEPFIRSLAGLGRTPALRDPDRYSVRNACCDVLVVGGGCAGLKAALDAGRAGARVILADQQSTLGGEARWCDFTFEGVPAREFVASVLEELARLPDVRLLPRTMGAARYDHDVVALVENDLPAGARRERCWIVRTSRLILATGHLEQPLIFENNDRPGIMLAGAARQYLLRYGVSAGRRVLIATNNDSAYALARDLKAAGVDVLGVADTRSEVNASTRAEMEALRVNVFASHIPVGTKGFGALREVTLGKLSAEGGAVTSTHSLRCDALAASGGFNPALHLFAHAGGKLSYDDASGALLPANTLPNIEIVGHAAGRVPIGPRISPVGRSARKWVDLLHDVTVADLELALRENYTSVEHVKRYTTAGMAADQGKTSSPSVLQVLGKLRGVQAQSLGYTTLRPPFAPVTLGVIAGREIGERFTPRRLLPMHGWHVAHGALMHDFGEWQRPVVYHRGGESRAAAVKREAMAVRTSVGIFDSSSLGKIELHGPDALSFLDRFYINDLTTLKPHRVRYGLMLRESGTLFDDGTVVVVGPERVLITTTSGNAGRVAQWLEEWHQCEWPQMRVAIVPVTDAWATVSLAGPKAREVLSRLPLDVDLSGESFPHLTMREGRLLDEPSRIYRVSFTGELTYEINVPANAGLRLWEALLDTGREDGIVPFGMDALMLMRLEKGFLHIGADTEGTTVPDDVGWGKVASAKQRDFVGKRSLTLPENLRPDRLQLVGLSGQRGEPFVVGAHVRVRGSGTPTDGWITSAGLAVHSDEPIALAMLRKGRSLVGTEVDLYDAGTSVGRARVVSPPFLDAAGARLNV